MNGTSIHVARVSMGKEAEKEVTAFGAFGDIS